MADFQQELDHELNQWYQAFENAAQALINGGIHAAKQVIDYCKEKNLQCLTVDEAYAYIPQKEDNNKIYEWKNIDELYSLVEMHIIYILLLLIVVIIIASIFIYRGRRVENNP